MKVTADQQRALYALQEVDEVIRRLENRRANLPEQKALDEHLEVLDKVDGEMVDARMMVDRLLQQAKRHEREIEQVNQRRKATDDLMFGGRIQSEKELDALRDELDMLRGKKSDLEEMLLEIMEQQDDTASLVEALEERRAELSGQITDLEGARDHAATEIDAELVERRAARAAAAAEVPPPLLKVYEDLRPRKNGVAVAKLQGRTCSGCRLELTAIELEELREGMREGLARCQQCARILVQV